MKLKINKLILTFISVFLLIFSSCQKEGIETNKNQNTKVYHKTFNEILKDNSFKTNYEKLIKSKKDSFQKFQ